MERTLTESINNNKSEKIVNKKSRIKSIDIAKAIGIFLIVLGHTLETGELRKFIYSFHVPLFFFLSGLCFSKKKNSVFIRKKMLTIYIPYILISLFSIGIYTIFGTYIGVSGNDLNIAENIKGMLYANPNLGNMQWNQPLWFLPSLMIQLIIINFLENIISNLKWKKYIRIIVITFLCVLGYFFSAYKIFLPFQLEAALCMLIFTYVGIIIKNNKEKILKSNLINKIKNKETNILPVFCIASLVLSIALVKNNSTLSVMQDKYGNYLIYFVVSTFMIINIMIISKFIDYVRPKQKLISYIGQNTLIILLLHKFPILFFQKVCPIIRDILNKEDTIINNIVAIIISLIVIGICMLFKYIVNLIILRSKSYDTNQ